jgi:predicted TIM-barrel fold metal-dependent hydrolase
VLRLLKDGPCSVKLSAAYHHPRNEAAGGLDKAKSFVATLIETVPDRLVWGSNWPHPQIPPRTPDDPAPFAPLCTIDDDEMLSFIVGWAGDAAMLKRIMVDNPGKFYDF